MNKQLLLRDSQQTLIQKRIEKLKRRSLKWEARRESIFTMRLLIGTVVAVFFVFIAMDQWTNIFLVLSGLATIAFIAGVIASRRVDRHLRQSRQLLLFLERVVARLSGNPLEYPLKAGNSPLLHHDLVRDLDLAGRFSVLELIDETLTTEGQALLLHDMLEPHYDEARVVKRQMQIAEISGWNGLLRKFVRTAARGDQLAEKNEELKTMMTEPFAPPQFGGLLMRLLTCCLIFWAAFLVQAFTEIQTHYEIIWVVYFIYTVTSLRRIDKVFPRIQDLLVRLRSIGPSFAVLEKIAKHKALAGDFEEFQTNYPSQMVKSFESRANMLSLQTHPLVLFVIHALVPWSFIFVSLAERDRRVAASKFPRLITQFYRAEALISLGLFYQYQTSIFPKIIKSQKPELEGVYHPLITSGKVVHNDFEWPKQKNLILITGSNMAGKSTFLRTAGVNQVLAQMGAPVFAERMSTDLFPIRTCIRVTDSVRDGFSYFFAETRRVAQLLAEAKEKQILFFIDEIFKGTNNLERFVGAKSLIEALAGTKALGMITTHDLELTKLQLPSIANYHFRDDITDGEMHFSYLINEGPCPTTNALKIMQQAGIPIRS